MSHCSSERSTGPPPTCSPPLPVAAPGSGCPGPGGWDDAAWEVATERLASRHWLDDGELTAEGLAMVAAIEADTDRLALGPWQALGDARCDRLAELLAPLRRAVVAAGEWPAGNPIGAPDPE